MRISHLIFIAVIFFCTSLGWVLLTRAVSLRSSEADNQLCYTVEGNWGPPMIQNHPRIYYASPTNRKSFRDLQPESSDIAVILAYDPKKKGLLRYRTYEVDFSARYTVQNPTPIRQTIYLDFFLPAKDTSYDNFELRVGEKESIQRTPTQGKITEALLLEPGETAPVEIAYRSRGRDEWRYHFRDGLRIRNFQLTMATDFPEIDFPERTGSPNEQTERSDAEGWDLRWEYPDVIDANHIGMAMPNVLNPGPTIARITLYAPVSLLFFFAVLVIVGMARNKNLHPMNYFFLAAGFFAFQLLLSYLVDVIPLHPAFFIASAVSLLLVGTYVWALGGFSLALITSTAQFAYMVLFSYSFFFDGLSGLTITIGAIITLAILMILTANIDWQTVFEKAKAKKGGSTPPPIPEHIPA